ncbi:MAG: hypothetical protein H6Q73_276 [Firmicutes bacterium]|nr:hypothetical protein [Bacillota bacterium]
MGLPDLKYKDETPLKTINKIRGILGDLGLLTVETLWKNSVEGFYSVSIEIENTSLMTNGKGTTRQYALASAYGEMMERLENLATYRLSLDLRPEAFNYLGFYYAPDEKMLSIDDFLNSDEEWVLTQFARLAPDIDRCELMRLWQGVSYETIAADLIALPYCNLGTKNISYIPIKMISKMYMSNGMCAGNTPEEALVQGLSEIMERYVNKRIIKEKLVPPTIPREMLAESYPKIEAMMTAIEASGPFEVILKDCSLEMGLPVVGIIYTNKRDQSYFVKFGAHPIFEIAVERTLTELLQGQDIRAMRGVREFAYCSKADDPDNIMGIMINGSGVYPAEFFSQSYSYEFSGLVECQAGTNHELLVNIQGLLQNNGYSLYVRDVSFLGFPGYHVIVPGMSEMEEFDDIKAISDYAEFNNFKRLVRHSGALDVEGAESIIKFLQGINYDAMTTVMEMAALPLEDSAVPWYYSNVDLFITALYYQSGKTAEAREAFNRFLGYIRQVSKNPTAVSYYKCVRDYFGTRLDSLDEPETLSRLVAFYSPEVVQGVINEFENREAVVGGNGQFDCWNCKTCLFQSRCLYQPMEEVYKVLKACYAASDISQDRLKILV